MRARDHHAQLRAQQPGCAQTIFSASADFMLIQICLHRVLASIPFAFLLIGTNVHSRHYVRLSDAKKAYLGYMSSAILPDSLQCWVD